MVDCCIIICTVFLKNSFCLMKITFYFGGRFCLRVQTAYIINVRIIIMPFN